MRFLCFHGLGTNADVLEIQTGPIREQLGEDHEFDFIDADFETEAAEGVEEIFQGPYFSWLDPPEPVTEQNLTTAIKSIRDFIKKNGPYDGALGFSQGAAMIVAVLLDHQTNHPFETPPFRAAILFNSGMPPALAALAPNGIKSTVSTAHIIGGETDYLHKESIQLKEAWPKQFRVDFEHNEGHAIPRQKDLTAKMTATIKKCINSIVMA